MFFSINVAILASFSASKSMLPGLIPGIIIDIASRALFFVRRNAVFIRLLMDLLDGIYILLLKYYKVMALSILFVENFVGVF